MTYTLHPGAEQHLAEALDFYAEQAGRLVAERLLNEFERVAAFLCEHPDIGTPGSRGRRVFPLRIFPYSIVYRNLGASVRSLVVRH